jgi:hypothetical protein
LETVRVERVRGGLRFAVTRRVAAPFTVDVFRESAGRRVLAERRVAHFAKRTASFSWKPGRRAGDGYYFARITIRAARVSDVRRIALRRTNGRFTTRPSFDAVRRCKLIRLARLSRPVFAGRRRVSLAIAAALSRAGSITVEVREGTRRVVHRTIARAGTQTQRLWLAARGTRRGDYVVTVTGRSGRTSERVNLTARRL